jgi:signal transduction histidine kinase
MSRTEDGRAVALEASAIALVAAVVTLTTLTHSARPAGAIVSVATAHVAVAALAWTLHGLAHATLIARLWTPMLVLLGASTWASDGHASAIGPLYVLVFAWLGMRRPERDLAFAVPIAAATYAGGLLAAAAPAHVVGSTLVLVPTAVAVCLLIATRVRIQRRLREELEARDRWRAALMATLAHDVRSPLSTVAGTLEVLGDDAAVPKRYHRLIDAAVRQTARILRLANGLLDVERVQHGRLKLDLATQLLAPIAQQVAQLTDPERVRVDIDPAVLAHVDPHRIEQVLYNLVNNALRHGRPPVVITATDEPSCTRIAVEDHGTGVPAEDVPRLFDRFSTSDHSPHSVGLGLWIVHTLVHAHGGTVRYENADHGGARFVIDLPATTQRSTNSPEAAMNGLPGPGGTVPTDG